MKQKLGNSFVLFLFVLVFWQGLSVLVFPAFEETVSPDKTVKSLEEIVLEETEKDSQKSVELPSALAETLSSIKKEEKAPPPSQDPRVQTRERQSQKQNRFRLFSLLLALLGAPLFSVIGASSLFGYATPSSIFVDVVDKLTTHTLFITLPLFTFAGYVLSESRAPERLVRFSRALLGWFPGGTALIVVASCAFFTAFTGASGVTIVALGGLLYPILIQENFGKNFSLGIITTGGSLGLLYPPSLPVIIYAVIANHSMQGIAGSSAIEIKELFLAGFIPCTMLLLVIAGYGMIVGHKREQEISPFSFKELRMATWQSLPELMIPVIMVIGYFGGYLQLTEAAGVTAMYVLVIEILLYKDIKIGQMFGIFRRSMMLIGAILLILMMAMALTNLLIMARVPDQLLSYMKDHIDSPWKFLLLLNIFLLIVGCLMDIFSAILVVVPLIIPISMAFNIDPLHLGVIFIVNLGIGYSTPPVGMNLFISSLRFKESIFKVAYTSLPFMGLLLVVLMAVTYIPAISVYPAKNPWVIGVFFGCVFLLFMSTYTLLAFLRKKKQVQ